MILTIGHTKGGVGKSTLAVQLATYLRAVKDEESVWLIDGDEQQSSLGSNTYRNSNESVKKKIACASYPKGQDLLSQVRSQYKVWNEIIIDVGATATNALHSALMVSDAILIPVAPRGYDLQALQQIQTVMNQAKSFGATFKAYACLSCADTSSQNSNLEAIEYLKNFPDIEYIDVAVSTRKSIAVASSFGESVFERKPKDPKACAEIEALANAIYHFE